MSSIIYKYLPPVRISVLRDLKIRITQPPILNDPFENLQLFDLKPKDLSENIKRSGATLLPSMESYLFKKIGSRLNQATNDAIGTRFGVISFSRTELSLLMWSHYAKDYTGFVVGIDTKSEFFTSRIKGLTQQLQDVTYTSSRREFELENMGISNGLLSTKPIEWAYEEEVRFIDTIDDEEMSSPKDELGFPVVLRSIPSIAVKEIIVGPRSTIEAEILNAAETSKLSAAIYRLVLDDESYRLSKRKIG